MTARPRPLWRALAVSPVASKAKWVALGFAGLLLAYAVAGNALLRTDWGRELINRRPERFSAYWSSAWTSLPGLVHVRDLELQGTSRRVAWRVRIDRGRAWIVLPSLAGRHFRAVAGEQEGAEVEIDLLPTPDARRPEARKRGWQVTLGGFEVGELRRVRVGDQELVGEGSVEGSAEFQVRGPMRLRLHDLDYRGARVLSDGTEVARDVTIDARLSTRPVVVTDPLTRMLGRTSGRLKLTAAAESLGFLSAYLEKVSWLSMDGSGTLEVEVSLDDGLLQPGSHFRLSGPDVWAEFFDFRAQGSGVVEGHLAEGEAGVQLAARLPEFDLQRLSDGTPLVSGERLEARVLADSHALDTPPEHLTGSLVLPQALVHDLSAFSVYIPRAAGIDLTGGRAELAAELRFDTDDGAGDGWLTLSGRGVSGSFGEAEFRSDLTVDGKIPRLDLLAGFYDVSGTALRLGRTGLAYDGRQRTEDWSATLNIVEGAVELATDRGGGEGPRGAQRVTADLRAEMLDTTPVVVLMEQRLPRLRWVDRLLTVPDVGLRGRLDLGVDRARLREFLVQGGHDDQLEIRAEVDAVAKDLNGAVFARYRRLSAALALNQGERRWKFTNSRETYDRAAADFVAGHTERVSGR